MPDFLNARPSLYLGRSFIFALPSFFGFPLFLILFFLNSCPSVNKSSNKGQKIPGGHTESPVRLFGKAPGLTVHRHT